RRAPPPPASTASFRGGRGGPAPRAHCVYKPIAGEAPLWDFPDGTLAGREVSAYLVSVALDWNIVPHTIIRDGPAGSGMVQLWIEEPGDSSTDIERTTPDLVDLFPAGKGPSGYLGGPRAHDA